MSEIAKCPICGGVPLDKWEVTSVRVFQTGQTCCGVDCNTNERWDQYAAAMKAEARHTALVGAVAWERECDEFLKSKTYSFFVAWEHLQSARAEVDRLIADCKGEE